MFLPCSLVKIQYFWEPPWPKSSELGLTNRQAWSCEFCVRKAVSSDSCLHPQVVLLAQFSIYVQKGGLKPHFLFTIEKITWLHIVNFIKIAWLFYCAYTVLQTVQYVRRPGVCSVVSGALRYAPRTLSFTSRWKSRERLTSRGEWQWGEIQTYRYFIDINNKSLIQTYCHSNMCTCIYKKVSLVKYTCCHIQN